MRQTQVQKYSIEVFNQQSNCVLTFSHRSRRIKPMSCFLHYSAMCKKILTALNIDPNTRYIFEVIEETNRKIYFNLQINRTIFGYMKIEKILNS